jgi:hypothetical protein
MKRERDQDEEEHEESRGSIQNLETEQQRFRGAWECASSPSASLSASPFGKSGRVSECMSDAQARGDATGGGMERARARESPRMAVREA